MSVDQPSLAMLEELGPVRAAALWLERLQRDDAGEDDAFFQQWLASSEANRKAWERARDLWDVFEEPDDEGAFAQLRREALTLRGRRPAANRTWYIGGAVAAAIVAVVFTAPVALKYIGQGRPETQPASGAAPAAGAPAPERYATLAGQKSTIGLSDGTKVELDGASVIEASYTRQVRAIRLLQGHAFFDVAHDAGRPFRVAAAGRVISDLGTSFEIRIARDGTRIVLVRGAIGVSKGDDPGRPPTGPVSNLVPGEQLLVRAGQADAITRVDLERISDWRQGVVQFDNTSLGVAVAELNRYTKEQLVIRDPAVASLRISGAFRTGDTKRFAQTLTALYPVRLVPLGDGKVEIVRAR